MCHPLHFLSHMAVPCLQGIVSKFQLSTYFLGDMEKGVMQAAKILLVVAYNCIAKGLYSVKMQRLHIELCCYQIANCIEHTISTTRCNNFRYLQAMAVYTMHNSFPLQLKVFANEGQVNMSPPILHMDNFI